MDIDILGGDYEFTLELSGASGGFNLRYRPVGFAESFGVILKGQPFQATEFSLCNYLMMRDRGDERMIAIPVFLNRAFRHGAIYVRRDSPLRSFDELRGRRVGAREYSQTAAVWARGLLRDEYGVDWRDITWYCANEQRFPMPSEAKVERGAADPEDRLLAGELDAMVAVQSKDLRRPLGERQLRPLLADPQAAEAAYFKKTGIFPPNHVVVLNRALVRENPGLPRAVFEAYERAKQAALKRRLGATLLPWSDTAWDRAIAMFGADPHPHGLTAINRAAVQKLIGYVHEQGLIRSAPAVEEIFCADAAQFGVRAT
jgi:4,5-dihydroxyphthalate decarboxylase